MKTQRDSEGLIRFSLSLSLSYIIEIDRVSDAQNYHLGPNVRETRSATQKLAIRRRRKS